MGDPASLLSFPALSDAGLPRAAVFLCIGLVAGTLVSLISFCIFGRCILKSSAGDGELLPLEKKP